MAEIEIGEIVVSGNGTIKSIVKGNSKDSKVQTDITIWYGGRQELREYINAIRAYMKQEARRLLGDG